MLEIPVLFIIFNRQERAAEVFEAIRAARPRRLYIAGDGPRETVSGEAKAVADCRALILGMIDWPCDVFVKFRDENVGLKKNIVEAISWLFIAEEEGIILEDDCAASPDFFRFCSEMLRRYADNASIAAVCGTSYLAPLSIQNSYYLGQVSDIWGWATWRSRWVNVDHDMVHWPEWRASRGLRRLVGGSALVSRYWEGIFDRTMAGRIQTWDYPWILHNFRTGRSSLFPKVPLVQNIGFGPGATNTISSRLPSYVRPVQELAFPLAHPVVLELKPDIERRLWAWRFGLTGPQLVVDFCKLTLIRLGVKRLRDGLLRRGS